MKAYLKYLLHRIGAFRLANGIRFEVLRWVYRPRNRNFLRQNQQALPPDHFLYETNQLDYRRFIAQGAQTAIELKEWVHPYMHTPVTAILDWGCGACRVTRHLPVHFPNASVTAVEANDALLSWNLAHFPLFHFCKAGPQPPLRLAPRSFGLILGFSVLTHIPPALLPHWLTELKRLLSDGGIAVLTTHGRYYLSKLTRHERMQLQEKGYATQAYGKPGSRSYAVYYDSTWLTLQLEDAGLATLAFTDGLLHPDRVGGQDLWILRSARDC